jgi:glutamate dehydrogenase (NADP+)
MSSQGLHPYAGRVLEDLRRRVPWEAEFLQAVEEVFGSISPLLQREPQYEGERILERIVEPERVLQFRVVWTDDRNRVNVHRGFRVQFNSALGPYKGGTRFHASVGLGSLKFLGFEQTFKNALTGLPLGGGKGGADFQYRGRSHHEMMRFCQSYMTELARHIGPNCDVPAGDIGVGAREIGYLFGQYKRLSNNFDGSLTGKGLEWGGSRLRPEATGFGVAYFAEEVLNARNESLQGKTVTLSGFGQVAWGAAKKVTELGGKVVSVSGPDGMVHIPGGLTAEHIEHLLVMRYGGRDEVKEFTERFGGDASFHAGVRPWGIACDIAMPCAIQNELGIDDAKSLINNGCKYVIEGANMPTTPDAMAALGAAGVCFVPGKASNAGGVACSGLEMTQNRMGVRWSEDHVDDSLRGIMKAIHTLVTDASAEFGRKGDYVLGANVGGFRRVAEAMIDQGAV